MTENAQQKAVKLAAIFAECGIHDPAATSLFLQRNGSRLRLDIDGELLIDGSSLEGEFASKPEWANKYRAPAEIKMTREQYADAMRQNLQIDHMKIRIVDDPPETKIPRPGLMTKAQFRQAMIDGVQGLDTVQEWND